MTEEPKDQGTTTRRRRRAWRPVAVGAAAVALSLGVAACGSGSTSSGSSAPVNTTTPKTAPNKKVFRETDTDIAVAPGEDFVIRVKSNASTGEQWTITTEADPSVAKLTKQSFLELPDTPPGTPGREEFAFTAGKAGTTTFAIQSCLHCKPGVGSSTTVSAPPGTEYAPTTYTFTIRVG